MRAVVLVGGFGTRLRPLTSTIPKQMLPIVDRPMIEHVLGKLSEHGVDDAILSLGYRPDAFIAAYPDDVCAGVRLHYAVEAEPLDTAGAVRFGLHRQDAALMTCFVPSYSASDHVHFVDGARGGYASAAAAIKAAREPASPV